MCGRTAVTRTAHQMLHSTYETHHTSAIIYHKSVKDKVASAPFPQYNIGPYNYLPVIRQIDDRHDKYENDGGDDGVDTEQLLDDAAYEADQSYTGYPTDNVTPDGTTEPHHTDHSTLVQLTCHEQHTDMTADLLDTDMQQTELHNTVKSLHGQRVLHLMRWGLLPFWTKRDNLYKRGQLVLINARSETVTQKTMFKHLVEKQRCMVCVDGFYEWQDIVDEHTGKTVKHPYFVHMPVDDSKRGGVKTEVGQQQQQARPPVMYFAGIYEVWRDVQTKGSKSKSPSPKRRKRSTDEHAEAEVATDRIADIYTCTILTCEPTTELDWLHDRMPVILKDKQQMDTWLDPSLSYAECVKRGAVKPCMGLQWYRVNSIVGSIGNKTVKCLQPYEDGQAEQYGSGLKDFVNVTPGSSKKLSDQSVDNSPLKHKLNSLPESITPAKKAKTSPASSTGKRSSANKLPSGQQSLDSMFGK